MSLRWMCRHNPFGNVFQYKRVMWVRSIPLPSKWTKYNSSVGIWERASKIILFLEFPHISNRTLNAPPAQLCSRNSVLCSRCSASIATIRLSGTDAASGMVETEWDAPFELVLWSFAYVRCSFDREWDRWMLSMLRLVSSLTHLEQTNIKSCQ